MHLHFEALFPSSTSIVNKASHISQASGSVGSFFHEEYTIQEWSSFLSGLTTTEPGTSASRQVTRPSLFSPYLSCRWRAVIAMAAETGTMTGTFRAAKMASSSASSFKIRGSQGSSACAMCDMVASTPGPTLASEWNEMRGILSGSLCLRINSFRFS